jgi:hypothetical protein
MEKLTKGLLVLIFILLVIMGTIIYFGMSLSSNKETQTFVLNLTLGSEIVKLQKEDNKVKIEFYSKLNLLLSDNLVPTTATSICLSHKKMLIDEGKLNPSNEKSQEEKEYVNKINEFIKNSEVEQVRIELKDTNGIRFECMLISKDNNKNTVVLISEGSRYTETLEQAEGRCS